MLGTDEANSFAMFLYAEGLKLWIPPHHGGLPTSIGFLTTFGFWSIFIPWPGYLYGDVMNTITTGNTGIPGYWAFEIDEEGVKFPCKSCYDKINGCNFSCILHIGSTKDYPGVLFVNLLVPLLGGC